MQVQLFGVLQLGGDEFAHAGRIASCSVPRAGHHRVMTPDTPILQGKSICTWSAGSTAAAESKPCISKSRCNLVIWHDQKAARISVARL